MSALQFLNKKSWHTGLIKNNEKVWLREQAAEKEKQRVTELQKQLEEERRLEEIQRLEIESGRLDPSEVKRRQRIEWMYEDVDNAHSKVAKAQQAKEQEDTLLGKKSASIPIGRREKDPEKLRLIDAENKLREDPMLRIEMERRKALEDSLRKKSASASHEERAKVAAKLARKAERREIREIRKRRRTERRATKAHRNIDGDEAGRKKLEMATNPEKDSRFGLHVPKTGSGVAVKDQFVRKNTNLPGNRKRPRIQAYEHGNYDSYDADLPEERAKLREQMELAAIELHRNRRESVKNRESTREREEQISADDRLWGSRNMVVSRFAYDALRSSGRGHISDRIQQRRPGAINRQGGI